jgi:hypothetical protein
VIPTLCDRWTFPRLEQVTLDYGTNPLPHDLVRVFSRRMPALVSLHLTTFHEATSKELAVTEDQFPSSFRTFRLTRSAEFASHGLDSWLRPCGDTLASLHLNAGIFTALASSPPGSWAKFPSLPNLTALKLEGTRVFVDLDVTTVVSALKLIAPKLRVVICSDNDFRKRWSSELFAQRGVLVSAWSHEESIKVETNWFWSSLLSECLGVE